MSPALTFPAWTSYPPRKVSAAGKFTYERRRPHFAPLRNLSGFCDTVWNEAAQATSPRMSLSRSHRARGNAPLS